MLENSKYVSKCLTRFKNYVRNMENDDKTAENHNKTTEKQCLHYLKKFRITVNNV